jgi:hypothetical protein
MGKICLIQKKKLYIKELKNWIKKNEKNMSKKFNIGKIKFLLFKLKVKNILQYFSKLY